ncbi:MAG: DUF2442 domain-containing protein [Clostridia bacterium]|nr:DUF2442 domain-containing protein [Clostridia bacterium]
MEKVKSVAVTPLEDLILFVAFNTDERRMFDVNPYFTGSWYGKLAGEVFFKTVRIAGSTVEWADGQDIAPHELYELSVSV